jgi:hypothetical protein
MLERIGAAMTKGVLSNEGFLRARRREAARDVERAA